LLRRPGCMCSVHWARSAMHSTQPASSSGGYSFAIHSRSAQAAGYPASGSSVAEHTLRRQQVLERADRHLQRSRQSRPQTPHDEDTKNGDAKSLGLVHEPWLTNDQHVRESLGSGLLRQQQQQQEEEEEEEQSEVPLPCPVGPAVADANDHEQAGALLSPDGHDSLEPLVQEDGFVRQPLGCKLLDSCLHAGNADLELQADSCSTKLQHHPLTTAATVDISLAVAATVETRPPSSELLLRPHGLDVSDVQFLAAAASVASSTSNHGQGLSTLAPRGNSTTPLTPLVSNGPCQCRLPLAKLRVETASLKKQLAEKLNEVQARDSVIEALLSEQVDVNRVKEELSTALHTIDTLKKSIANDKLGQGGQCVICWEGTPCYALVPCGHLLLCQRCAGRNLEQCPVCRRKVVASLRVYRP